MPGCLSTSQPGASLSANPTRDSLSLQYTSFVTMFNSTSMPILMSRPGPVFSQPPLSLGLYPSPTMFLPPTGLYPPLAAHPSQVMRQSLVDLPQEWKAALAYRKEMMQPPTNGASPGAKLSPLLSYSGAMPPATASFLSLAAAKERDSAVASDTALSLSPSPPRSPAESVGSQRSNSSCGGEKPTFTIDAILSSKPQSRHASTSSSASDLGSPRGSMTEVSDRGLTPSPDAFVSPPRFAQDPAGLAPLMAGGRRDGGVTLMNGFKHFSGDISSTSRSAHIKVLDDEGSPSSSLKRSPTTHVSSDKGLKRALCSGDDPSLEWGAAGGRAKRVRTIFTQDQLERLEQEFERQQYMVGTERLYLAAELHLSESQVKVWFQNRRIKWRKQNLEKQQVHLTTLHTTNSDVQTDIRCDVEKNDIVDQSERDDDQDVANEATMEMRGYKPQQLQSPASSSSEEKIDATASLTSTTDTTTQCTENERRFHLKLPEIECSPPKSARTSSVDADLQSEVKRVEQRLAMRLSRRSMLMQTAMSSSSSSSLSSSARLMSTASSVRMSNIRRL